MHTVGQIDPYPTEALASAGYAVLLPMPRGGAGYGEAGQRAIVNAWGEADYRDIMTGVDALIAQGIADPDRLGVMGASYGGYMTNWIVTQTGRFKAASAGASISDLADAYYLSEGGEFMVDYFKRPWENRESYAAHSPLTFADRVTTPLLIQHGERDPRVPIAGAWKFYRGALKALGKTVEFDIYPRGGHVLCEPMQQREQMRRNVEWFARWIVEDSRPRLSRTGAGACPHSHTEAGYFAAGLANALGSTGGLISIAVSFPLPAGSPPAVTLKLTGRFSAPNFLHSRYSVVCGPMRP